MNRTKTISPEEAKMKKVLEGIINSDEFDFSSADMAKLLKGSLSSLGPIAIKSLIFKATGLTVFDCKYCNKKNRVVTGEGDMAAIKYALDKGLDWDIQKTLNLNIDVGVPRHIVNSSNQELQKHQAMKMIVDIWGITPQEAFELTNEVIYGTTTEGDRGIIQEQRKGNQTEESRSLIESPL